MLQNRRAFAILAVCILILGAIGYAWYRHRSSLPQKPAPGEIQQPSDQAQEPTWYIQFTVKDQKITAYTETSYARVAANGNDYFTGGIAVHPLYPGIDPRKPAIPFGTRVFLTKPVKVHGVEYDSFTVMDTGDINYRLWAGHPYWFDIYYGTSDYWNNKGARDFGVKTESYYWVEKWE